MDEKWQVNFDCDSDFQANHRVLLHAANLGYGTNGFTSPPKEGMLRIFSPEKSDGFGLLFYFAVSCASLSRYWTYNCRLYRIVLHAVDFTSRKNPTVSVGSEPAILGTRGQHANP
jgi:hypothetical protein